MHTAYIINTYVCVLQHQHYTQVKIHERSYKKLALEYKYYKQQCLEDPENQGKVEIIKEVRLMVDDA